MKRCPSCNQTYSDDSQVFCSNDGTRLEASETTSAYDPQATMLAPPPPPTAPSLSPPSFNDPQPPSYGSSASPPPSYGSGSSGYGANPSPVYGSSPAQSDYNSPAAWSPASAQVAQPYQGGQFMQGAGGKQQGLAIGSLVTGILSMLCCFSFVTGPVAVVLGIMAMNKEKAEPNLYTGKTLAMVGVITGALGTVIGTLAIILRLLGTIRF